MKTLVGHCFVANIIQGHIIIDPSGHLLPSPNFRVSVSPPSWTFSPMSWQHRGETDISAKVGGQNTSPTLNCQIFQCMVALYNVFIERQQKQ